MITLSRKVLNVVLISHFGGKKEMMHSMSLKCFPLTMGILMKYIYVDMNEELEWTFLLS